MSKRNAKHRPDIYNLRSKKRHERNAEKKYVMSHERRGMDKLHPEASESEPQEVEMKRVYRTTKKRKKVTVTFLISLYNHIQKLHS